MRNVAAWGATIGLCVVPGLAMAQVTPPAVPPAASQNPSPMQENSRTHDRLKPRDLGGVLDSFPGPAGKKVELWIPDNARGRGEVDLVIHFHGAGWVANQAVAALGSRTVAVTLNLGTGSGIYDRSFSNPASFDSLLTSLAQRVQAVDRAATGSSTSSPPPVRFRQVILTAWSAGHGAVRAIIRDPRGFARVDAILLIDGMHTSYVPEGVVLYKGGTIDTTNLVAFANFARAAMRGEKRFLVTHSEIFPGTFVSTTETADWLLRAVNVKRVPVLKWGPRGTQQLSEARSGRFELRGYAGNSAPDHVDELHSLPELLAQLLKR